MAGQEPILERLEQRAADVRAGKPYVPLLLDTAEDEGIQLFAALLRSSFEGIALNGRTSRRILEVSDSFCHLTGYARQELIGRTSVELGLVTEDRVRNEVLQRVDEGLDGLYEVELRRRDGSVRWVEFSHQHIGDLILSIVRDVTERRRLEADLRHLADTDPLTGVLNRRRFRQEVERELLESRRFGDAVSLLIIDLDGFKAVNDAHGHRVGDAVLREVADRIRIAGSPEDLVVRLAGDEFCVLLPAPSDDDTARRRAHDIGVAMARPYDVATGPISLGASVGWAASLPTDRPADLLERADLAMYDAKRGRRAGRPSPDPMPANR